MFVVFRHPSSDGGSAIPRGPKRKQARRDRLGITAADRSFAFTSHCRVTFQHTNVAGARAMASVYVL